MGFVELHFHLLPGVDDGPESLAESVALARAARADGTAIVVATPHIHPDYLTDTADVGGLTREVTARLRREGVALSVLPGGELAHTMVGRLDQPALERIAQGPPGRRWLLLEAPFDGLGANFTAAAHELRARGFGMVIAHPERIADGPQTRLRLDRERALGSMVQVTADAISGAHGENVRRRALDLIRAPGVAVIASDAHGPQRPPALRAALASLAAGGERDAGRFSGTAPRMLLTRGLAPGVLPHAA
jgi:protein-tyrosine phosphatase